MTRNDICAKLYISIIIDVRCIMTNYKEIIKIFKAFDDSNRLRILELLQDSEKCACVLLEDLNIGQSTLSHHMKILCDAGVVDGRKEGKWMYYSISEEGADKAKKTLAEITKITGTGERSKLCCECDLSGNQRYRL